MLIKVFDMRSVNLFLGCNDYDWFNTKYANNVKDVSKGAKC